MSGSDQVAGGGGSCYSLRCELSQEWIQSLLPLPFSPSGRIDVAVGMVVDPLGVPAQWPRCCYVGTALVDFWVGCAVWQGVQVGWEAC